MKNYFLFHLKELKYSTLEDQEEEIKPRPSYTTQLLGLLLNIQQPLQTRFDKILRKLEVSVMERSEEEEGGQRGDREPCMRCGQCILQPALPPAPPPLTGEEQIYPQQSPSPY